MALLIDSSVFIGLERRGETHRAIRRFAADQPTALSAVTLSELLVGLHRARTPEQRDRRAAFIDPLMREMLVLSFDLAVAETHARIWSDLVVQGRSIGAHDLMIAATALTHGYSILTENLREFERVPGLVVTRPTW